MEPARSVGKENMALKVQVVNAENLSGKKLTTAFTSRTRRGWICWRPIAGVERIDGEIRGKSPAASGLPDSCHVADLSASLCYA